MYADEASVSVVPALTHTYAPRGKTPVITTSTEINLRLYMASAISASGKIRYLIRNQPFDSKAVIEFLEYLRVSFRRKLLIIWDGASIHDSREVKAYLDSKKNREFYLVMQPHYSPELNADEQVWNYLKGYQLKNTCHPTVKQLKEKITAVMEGLKQQPSLIRQFFHHPKLGYYN
ncbi:MAG: IS630 family transposase [Sphingobacteriales bacterium]|nr:MAG: IS630 family transposase [Sphingobacteriales bacterium]